jgi:6-phosphogluconolactonase (cycloisomerase 2 family)
MRYLVRLVTVLASAFGLLVGTPAVLAHADEAGDGAGHAVFVQTNDPTGNSIDVFARGGDGSLTYVATYATGGLGGREVGAAVDPLASQSALVFDAQHRLLLAPNAGSNTISVFSVRGTTLHLNQVIGSGGPFPSSIGVHDNIAYVLDAGFAGSIQGYRIDGDRLRPIEGSQRSLNLRGTINPPAFLAAPAQLGFTPDGAHLVVALKGNSGGSVDVFSTSPSGRLSAGATTTVVGGNAFAFSFDPAGRLALVNAGLGNLSTYTVNPNGSLSLVSAGTADGQAAACWVVANRGFYLVANAGSGSLSEYTIGGGGGVTLQAQPVAAGAIPGAIDSASSGQFVYAQAGKDGTLHSYRVHADGTLTSLGSLTVHDGANQEGIAAS